jgi:hypothetical protein
MRRLIALFLLLPTPGLAKPPTLDHLYPAGAGRGQTVTVTAAGSFDRWPVGVHVDGPGVQAVATEKKGELRVAVAPGAPVGRVWLRLHDAEGASPPRPFLVGTLPEVSETEPNDDPAKAQEVKEAAVVVNGRLEKRGDVDGFAVTLKKGQTLVAAMAANGPLGAPMDGVLQVATPAGIVLEQVDDAPGRDPLLAFEAPADGPYVVRAFAFPAEPNSSIAFAGGPNYVYRLTLTTGGYVDHALPVAVSREAPGPVELIGWNLPEGRRSLTPRIPADADPGATLVLARPDLAGAAVVALVPHPARVEDPKADAEPQPLPVPGTVSGRIDPAGDTDAFTIAAKKGQALQIDIQSRALGFPLDSTLKVLDGAGKTLAEQDDPGRGRRATSPDPALRFDPPADGEYRVVVADLNDAGGPRHVYRLDVTPAGAPETRLRLKADRFTLAPGKPLEIPVAVERQGDEAPIVLTVEGLPDGLDAAPAESAAGKTAKEATLAIQAEAPLPWSGPIHVVGRAKDGRRLVATFPVEGLAGAEGDSAWLTVAPSASK